MVQGEQERSNDERLRAAVLQLLAADADLVGLDVRVGVLNAIAHLGGRLPSLALWERAAQIAGSVLGVRGVVNRIEAPGAPSPSRTINLDFITPPHPTLREGLDQPSTEE